MRQRFVTFSVLLGIMLLPLAVTICGEHVAIARVLPGVERSRAERSLPPSPPSAKPRMN